MDAVRADHLSTYGYQRETSPQLDALARGGVVFETVISPIPQTGPACASLLTGRWPASLALHANDQRLSPGPRTLGEVLGAAGYETAGFVSGYPLIRTLAGLDRGFSTFDDEMPDARGIVAQVQRRGSKTTAAALRWLARRSSQQPFFLWVHYYDPHGDYLPGPPFETMFAGGPKGPFLSVEVIPQYQRRGNSTDAGDYIARYDGELRYVDNEIGKLLDGLAKLGHRESTLIAVVSDHGENLVEHGAYFDHGNEIYLEAVQVPLVLAGPGVPADGRRIRGIARIPDMMPTLLGLLRMESQADVEGVSLVASLASSTITPSREAFSEARLEPAEGATLVSGGTPKLAARDERFTVLWRLATGKVELYDRSTDPHEERDILSTTPPDPVDEQIRVTVCTRLQALLDAQTRRVRPEPRVLSPELRALLERRVTKRVEPG